MYNGRYTPVTQLLIMQYNLPLLYVSLPFPAILYQNSHMLKLSALIETKYNEK